MDKAFKFLSPEEFQKLTMDERWDYLRRALADIREKLEHTKRRSERMKGDLTEES